MRRISVQYTCFALTGSVIVGITYRQWHHQQTNQSLIEAIRLNSVVKATEALDQGADPNAYESYTNEIDRNGLTVPDEDRSFVKSLWRRLRGGVREETSLKAPLHIVSEVYYDDDAHPCTRPDNKELINLLIDRGADVNIRDSFGDTPLITAVRGYKVETVRWLLQRRARADLRNRNGSTALDITEELGPDSIMRLLKSVRAK